MRTQIITAVVGVVGTGLGASLTLIGTTWQARIAAHSKRRELDQSKEQARTQLYVDHVGRRLENRRATYIAFMQAVSTLVQATRDDRIDGARLTGQIVQHLAEMAEAAGEIDTARNTVMIDGPQAVASQAAELCRIPYRLASAVSAIYDESLDDDGRQQALQAAVDIRVNLVRELTLFSVMASAALNLDEVGNHLDSFQTPGAAPSPA
ncbi:hypothetical protein [Streptomyces sp. NBC_00989]|uniref:hypothetical protein n=1 Tax=Streptomyces sp. NBC_00989 TaxID=2903705 RepID=UPI003865A803|nr:hypothetical protein OG714_38370 [Streptomyces sp. NBC_00989]